ncbi:MAG: ankyrin repeat domain-containing protein [Gemmatimonadetes bacterium]|nr:ankyrin repeat domain-containing protein [Gemmatimonadota bacterium]
MVPNADESFLAVFARGDLVAARAVIDSHPSIGRYDGYKAHPLLREFVARNCGHCYKASHRAIADLLIPDQVRSFRNAVMADRIEEVRAQLAVDPRLVRAEFTGSRGIAQAIHHWRSIPVAMLLLDRGADVDALTTVGCAGETPLMTQLRFGTLEGVRFLLDRGANPNLGGLKHTPSASMVEGLNLLLQYGWDVNEQVGGRTLLHHDANHGDGGRVRLLLNLGADPNIQDAEDRTALHLVCARGVGSETIRDLVEAGADLNVRDHEGRTPLDHAESASRDTAARVLLGLDAEGNGTRE